MQFDKAQDILRRLEALTPKERFDWAVETSKQFKKKLAEFFSAREQQKRAGAIAAITEQQLELLDHDLGEFFNGITDDGSSGGSTPVNPRGVVRPLRPNSQDRRSLASRGIKR